jgi:AcrR family transcriptional regulator
MSVKKAATKKSAETRLHILRCATEIFNKRGVSSVNTHDIAKAADLSPGNLYYHFKNKEEIVRSIFDGIDLFSPEGWRNALSNSPEGFHDFVHFFFSQLKEYRFIIREKLSLIRADHSLAKKWRAADARLFLVMKEAASHWVNVGIMKPFSSSAEAEAFIINSWIILNFAHSFFEAEGEKQPSRFETLVNRQLHAFLRPYHTTRGLKILDRYFSCALAESNHDETT